MERLRRLWAVSVGIASSAVLLMSCGSPAAAPQTIAEEFYQAIADRENATACDLLAPQTRTELEQSEHAPCQKALAGLDLPAAGEAVRSQRFGNQAQVRLDHDTTFLAEFADGWRIVAAGCTPQEPLPYDCTLTGI